MTTDDDIVRALHRAGAVDPGVDVHALTAGARGRARTIRRRRQGGVGIAAVIALAVPVGISQWPTTSTAPPAVVATQAPPTREPVTVPAAAMLPDASVFGVADGLDPGESSASETANGGVDDGDYGMCTSLPLPDGSGALVAERTTQWTSSTTTVDSPFRNGVTQKVRILDGTGSTDVVDFAREQLATACATPDETGAWTGVPSPDGAVALETGGATLGEDSVIGYAAYGTGDTPLWRTRVVAREGTVALDLSTELTTTTADEAVELTYGLATTALQRITDGLPQAQVQP